MRSWFSSSSKVISLVIKATDGKLEDKIQIQSDESVSSLKALIDEKFQCDPDLQKLVFHGKVLEDKKLLSSYKIINNSTILLMNTKQQQTEQQETEQPLAKPKARSMFDKSNPYYQSQTNIQEPGNKEQEQYFDPILNRLSKYHPELPMAVMEHSKSIGDLMKDLNKRFEQKLDDKNDNEQKLTEEQQSLATYYYYLSLASLSAVTTTVASSVYQHLPSKDQISSSIHSIIQRPSSADGSNNDPNLQNIDSDTSKVTISWIEQLQKLVSNTKAEKAAIDRLVSLGFNKRESVEAYLACDKDEALAALFMSQNNDNTPTKGAPDKNDNDNDNDDDNDNDEEKKEDNKVVIDASMGYINNKNNNIDDDHDKTIINRSIYFKQFQKWIRNVFDDDESYYRYLLLFMKQKIADITCLEDINYDEEYLINIGIDHRIHRKRIIKAIGLFVNNKNKFEIWWNETIQFKKYLKLFTKFGIWDLEELLLQIRSQKDIINKIGIDNETDIESIFKHIDNLRNQHSLYSDIKPTAMIPTPYGPTYNAYNPNVMNPNAMNPNAMNPNAMNPNAMNPNAMNPGYSNNNNYNAAPPPPPMPIYDNNRNNVNIADVSNISINSNNSQKEGVMTQH